MKNQYYIICGGLRRRPKSTIALAGTGGGVALFIKFMGGGFFPRLLKRKLDTTPSIHDA